MTTEAMNRLSTWVIDPTHSIAEFAVKHFVVTTTKGRFRDLGGTLWIDEVNPENSSAEAKIAVSSIDTNLEERDDHVRSDDFLNAEAYPYITFRSTRLRRLDDERFTLTGDLTMRDVTREIKLAGEYEGQIDDPWGNRRAAFTATTQISRNDFNIRWNLLLKTGGLAVSDNVQITLQTEAILQAPSPSEPTMIPP